MAVMKLVIGVNCEMKQPWGLSAVISEEEAIDALREFLAEYGLPQFAYDPTTTVVQITHRDTPQNGRMGLNHHYGLCPVKEGAAWMGFESLESSITQPHWDITIDSKHYITVDTPVGLQKLRDSLIRN